MRFNKNIYFKFKTTIELFLLIIILSDNFIQTYTKEKNLTWHSPNLNSIVVNCKYRSANNLMCFAHWTEGNTYKSKYQLGLFLHQAFHFSKKNQNCKAKIKALHKFSKQFQQEESCQCNIISGSVFFKQYS